MKKLNNKGFAISSLLYGILIVGFLAMSLLMSSLATNRKNTSTLVEKIEEDLERYGKISTEFKADPGTQKYIVPYAQAGWYKIEIWYYKAGEEGNPDVKKYASTLIKAPENQQLNFELTKDIAKVSLFGQGHSKVILSTEESLGATETIDRFNSDVINGEEKIIIANRSTKETNVNKTKGKISRLILDDENEHKNETPPNSILDGTKENKYYIYDIGGNYLKATGSVGSSKFEGSEKQHWKIKRIEEPDIYIITTDSSGGEKILYDDGEGSLRLITYDETNIEENQKWAIEEKGTGSSVRYHIANPATRNKVIAIDSSPGTVTLAAGVEPLYITNIEC